MTDANEASTGSEVRIFVYVTALMLDCEAHYCMAAESYGSHFLGRRINMSPNYVIYEHPHPECFILPGIIYFVRGPTPLSVTFLLRYMHYAGR